MCFHLKIKQTAHLFAQTTTNVPSVCFFCYDMRSLCRLFQIFIHLWTKHIILSLISRIRTRVFKRVASLSKLKLRSERTLSSPYMHHCTWSVQRPKERILWRTWITPQERRKPNKEKSLNFLLKYEPNIGVVLAGFAGCFDLHFINHYLHRVRSSRAAQRELLCFYKSTDSVVRYGCKNVRAMFPP